MQAKENAQILKILEENTSPKLQVPLVSTPTAKTPRKVKVNIDKETPNQNGASVGVAQGETTTTMKTPKGFFYRTMLQTSKDLSAHHANSISVVEGETAKKPTAEVSPRKANQMQEKELSSEPEAKKRKKGRPTNSERKKGLPIKQRISNRSTKRVPRCSVAKINYSHLDDLVDSADELDDVPPSYSKYVPKQKVASVGVVAETLHPTVSTHDVQAKTDVNVPKVKETPATSDSLLPPKKSATITPGTARKRVAGEGRTASLQKVLLELPNLCDPNVFSDILHKTYGGRFEASKVFECLTTSDLKQAILKKFSFSNMVALYQSNGGATGGKFVTEATTEVLLQELLSREEFRNSSKISKETKKALNNNTIIETVLDVASVDVIANRISARPDLQTFEKVLNVLLQNAPENLSDETKKSIDRVLFKKFKNSELCNISHKVLKVLSEAHK